VATARELGDTQLEAQLRGYLGLVLARLRRGREALDVLQRAEALLHGGNDALSLGLLLCQHAMAAGLLGEAAGGRALLARALTMLEPLRPADDSEIGRALAEARSLLGT
jgi:hypothetical protein